jgi:hypothetical protein
MFVKQSFLSHLLHTGLNTFEKGKEIKEIRQYIKRLHVDCTLKLLKPLYEEESGLFYPTVSNPKL